MRKSKLIALVGLFLTSFTITAWATHDGPSANFSLYADIEGGVFDGWREWYPQGTHQGYFHYEGLLTDDVCDDGDNVYTKLKVEGYAWESFYGDQKCDGSGDDQLYQDIVRGDPQVVRTNNARWAMCRDRAFPYSDNCTNERVFERPN